jgi:cytochrome c-type biogenesis protein
MTGRRRRFNILAACGLYAMSMASVTAFVPRTATRILSTTGASTATTPLQMNPLDSSWQDTIYQTQSWAGVWANSVLNVNSASSWWTMVPVMYGAGLATSVSPCVWGLLPLTTTYIVQAAGEGDGQTVLPAVAFLLGLAAVFGAAGAVAAWSGSFFLTSSDNWPALISHTICLLMGLQLLELITLPSFDQLGQKFSKFSPTALLNDNQQSKSIEPVLVMGTGQIVEPTSKKGSLLRVFLLGGSSALASSPCATPVLTSLLAYLANSSTSVWTGALLLFVYTLGYATPLLSVAATGGKLLLNLNNFNYSAVAPWVSPVTGGILLWYGTDGLLTTCLGDPALAGLAPVLP